MGYEEEEEDEGQEEAGVIDETAQGRVGVQRGRRKMNMQPRSSQLLVRLQTVGEGLEVLAFSILYKVKNYCM